MDKFIFMSRTFLLLLMALIIQQASAQKKPSKYPDGVIMKKGVKFCGLNFEINNKKTENENLLVTYIVDEKKKGFKIRIDPGYIIKENLGVGLGFSFGFDNKTILQKNSDGTLTDIKSLQREFAIRPFVKQFIQLGRSHKFYIVIPTELQIGYESKLTESTTQNILTRNYKETRFYGIEMRPGLLAFLVENFGFEVNVGAFGLRSSVEKGKSTNQPDSRVQKNDLSLQINLLQLTLGFSIYF